MHFCTMNDAVRDWENEEADDLAFHGRIRRTICELTPETYRRLYEAAERHRVTIEEMTMHVLAVRHAGGRARLTEMPADELAGHA